MDALEKIEKVLEHIQNVQRNCYKLGFKIIKSGDIELGRNLIANGQIHDNSKLKGIEFERLFYGDPLLVDVVKHHSSTNMHHPEYWGSIHEMPKVFIAEMVCDWAARASEFGSDLKKWVYEEATIKFDFTMHSKVGENIELFLNMLLEKPFIKIKT